MRLGKAQRAIMVCAGVFAPAFIYRSCFLSPNLPRRSLSGAATSAFSTMSGAAAPLTFLDSSNKEVPMAEAFKGKSVALYFAGEWCPMCTAFTPQLTEFLAKNGEKSAVLVSSDFTQEAYETHRGHLPSSMMAVPYGTELQDELKRKFRLWGGKEKPTFGEGRRGGIPALVVINEAGEEVKYLDAESKGAGALGEW